MAHLGRARQQLDHDKVLIASWINYRVRFFSDFFPSDFSFSWVRVFLFFIFIVFFLVCHTFSLPEFCSGLLVVAVLFSGFIFLHCCTIIVGDVIFSCARKNASQHPLLKGGNDSVDTHGLGEG